MERARETRRAVCRRLEESGLLRENRVDVEVEGGVVTLTGTVASIEDKTAAKNVAHSTPGVLDVAEELDLKTSGAQARKDAAIARAARAHLKDLLGEGHARVHLTVGDGCLWCEGRVSSAAVRRKVSDRLHTIDGLHGLIDCLEVTPDAAADSPDGANEE